MKENRLLVFAVGLTMASVGYLIINGNIQNLGTAGGFMILSVLALALMGFKGGGFTGKFRKIILYACIALAALIAADVFLGMHILGLAVI